MTYEMKSDSVLNHKLIDAETGHVISITIRLDNHGLSLESDSFDGAIFDYSNGKLRFFPVDERGDIKELAWETKCLPSMEAELLIDTEEAKQLLLMLDSPCDDCGRGEVIFDEEVTFRDGWRMAIQVITSEEPDKEPCWSQGVLFDRFGTEIGFTEPSDELLGEFRVGNYAAVVDVPRYI